MKTLTYENVKSGQLVKWSPPDSKRWIVGVVVKVVGFVTDSDYPCSQGVEILFGDEAIIVDLYYNRRIFLLEEE
mgnify:CR=1 FL=1